MSFENCIKSSDIHTTDLNPTIVAATDQTVTEDV